MVLPSRRLHGFGLLHVLMMKRTSGPSEGRCVLPLWGQGGHRSRFALVPPDGPLR